MTDQQHPIAPPGLSPAEQVMIAVTHIYQEHGGEPPARAVAAATLRAAVDQAMPVTSKPDDGFCCPPVETIVWTRIAQIRKQFLAIVTELENQ